MDVTDSGALTRYFAGRISKAQDALKTVHLNRYADEVVTMVPANPEGFERFVYWCEAMHSCVQRWAALVEVRATHTDVELREVIGTLGSLARDARELLRVYEARRARGVTG